MAYLGSGMEEVEKTVATVNMVCDTMTGDGSTATMTIGASQEMPGHVNNVSIYFDGVAQRPTTDYTLSGKTVTFSTAPEASVNVVCLSYASEFLDVISDGTVYGAEILDGALTDAKIATGVSASKLTGALPAIDGSAVTNFAPRAVTKNASDPATTTNPANGVGTVWANTTSGEMYVCLDATTDNNIWKNIGSGEGDIAKPFGGLGGGTVSGYTSGGNNPTALAIIDKFAFASNVTAASHGTITQAREGCDAGYSSATQGFTAGGNTGGPFHDTIDKFTFASDADATDVGNLTAIRYGCSGQNSATHGYTSGGNADSNVIDRFTFGASNNATDVGDLSVGRRFLTGQQY